MEKESVRWRETETRMLNVSSCVHLTPLEKKKKGVRRYNNSNRGAASESQRERRRKKAA